jgi:hypothetical protein
MNFSQLRRNAITTCPRLVGQRLAWATFAMTSVGALATCDQAAAFNVLASSTRLTDAAGATIVADEKNITDLIDPIPPGTSLPTFITGSAFRANAFVNDFGVVGVSTEMLNRPDVLTSRASFSFDVENTSTFARRLDLSFLIYPGEIFLVAANAKASFTIDVGVFGPGISGVNEPFATFFTGGTLSADAMGQRTWTNDIGAEDIGMPANGPFVEPTLEIPLAAPSLAALLEPGASGSISYDMELTIDATGIAGGGYLEIARARVSDPLQPPATGAITEMTFTDVPEPAGLTMLAAAAVALSPRRRARGQKVQITEAE